MAQQTIGDIFTPEQILEATRRWHERASAEAFANYGRDGIEEIERLAQVPIESFAAWTAKQPATPENVRFHMELAA